MTRDLLTLLVRAMLLLLLFFKILGFIALVLVLIVLILIFTAAFLLFALAVQDYRVHIMVGAAACFLVFVVWLLRNERRAKTTKEDS